MKIQVQSLKFHPFYLKIHVINVKIQVLNLKIEVINVKIEAQSLKIEALNLNFLLHYLLYRHKHIVAVVQLLLLVPLLFPQVLEDLQNSRFHQIAS